MSTSNSSTSSGLKMPTLRAYDVSRQHTRRSFGEPGAEAVQGVAAVAVGSSLGQRVGVAAVGMG
jgi:hypothetical protein